MILRTAQRKSIPVGLLHNLYNDLIKLLSSLGNLQILHKNFETMGSDL